MKLEKKRFVIASLSTLVAASLVGSISGTIAWYQYSTRASASIVGTDASCTDSIRMMIGTGEEASSINADSDKWTSTLKKDDIYEYIKSGRETAAEAKKKTMDDAQKAWEDASDEEKASKKEAYDTAKAEYEAAKNLSEATVGNVTLLTNYTDDTGSLDKDGKLGTFYSSPHHQIDEPSKWGLAGENDYIQFPLTFKVTDNLNTGSLSSSSKDVYIDDLSIFSTDDGQRLSKSIRVHFDSVEYTKATGDTYSKSSTSTDTLVSKETDRTITYGPLDLNSDKQFDTKKYTYEYSTDKDYLSYGVDGSVQTCYTVDDIIRKYDSDNNVVAGSGHVIGKIPSEGYLTVTVTMWVEGWHTYSSAETGNSSSNPVKYASENYASSVEELNTAIDGYLSADAETKNAKMKTADKALQNLKENYQKYLQASTKNAQYLEAKKNLVAAASKKDNENEDKDKTIENKVNAYLDACEAGLNSAIDALALSDFDADHKTVDSVESIKNALQNIENLKNSIVSLDEALEEFDTSISSIDDISYLWDDALKNVNFQIGMTFGI